MPKRLSSSETRATCLAFLVFFLLLYAYYILRPLREELGIIAGVDQFHWLFSATFLASLVAVPLVGWLGTAVRRSLLVPILLALFAATLLIFSTLISSSTSVSVARAFVVCVSVWNLVTVSIFWSLMTDLFSSEQGKRLFGLIATGGSIGAIAGPLTTTLYVSRLGPSGLLLLSAALLVPAILILLLLGGREREAGETPKPIIEGTFGGIFAGVLLTLRSPYLLLLGLLTLCTSIPATLLYLVQMKAISVAGLTPIERTELFAIIDLIVNFATMVIQSVFAARVITRLGLFVALIVLPVLSIVSIGYWTTLQLLIGLLVFFVLRRVFLYGLNNPAREVLFTVLTAEEKYKAKNFLDTVVYRGSDSIGAWIGRAIGVSSASTIFLAPAIALNLLGIYVAFLLVKRHEKLLIEP